MKSIFILKIPYANSSVSSKISRPSSKLTNSGIVALDYSNSPKRAHHRHFYLKTVIVLPNKKHF